MKTVGVYRLENLSRSQFNRLKAAQQEAAQVWNLCMGTHKQARNKATRQVINFCVENEVGSLFIGNPHGVRNRDYGRHHNQRMALWEYGKDIDYLTHKAKQAHISCFTGSERGTSSQCPCCGHKHKPKGRNWACRVCGFTGHRDLVGSVNMHPLAFGTHVRFPRSSRISDLGFPGGVAGPIRPWSNLRPVV